MKAILVAIALSLLQTISAASEAENESKDVRQECPTTGAELKNLKTEQQVLQCLGKPRNETSKPDGRHTGLYGFSNGLTVVFLYDKEGNVVKLQGYRDSKQE